MENSIIRKQLIDGYYPVFIKHNKNTYVKKNKTLTDGKFIISSNRKKQSSSPNIPYIHKQFKLVDSNGEFDTSTWDGQIIRYGADSAKNDVVKNLACFNEYLEHKYHLPTISHSKNEYVVDVPEFVTKIMIMNYFPRTWNTVYMLSEKSKHSSHIVIKNLNIVVKSPQVNHMAFHIRSHRFYSKSIKFVNYMLNKYRVFVKTPEGRSHQCIIEFRNIDKKEFKKVSTMKRKEAINKSLILQQEMISKMEKTNIINFIESVSDSKVDGMKHFTLSNYKNFKDTIKGNNFINPKIKITDERVWRMRELYNDYSIEKKMLNMRVYKNIDLNKESTTINMTDVKNCYIVQSNGVPYYEPLDMNMFRRNMIDKYPILDLINYDNFPVQLLKRMYLCGSTFLKIIKPGLRCKPKDIDIIIDGVESRRGNIDVEKVVMKLYSAIMNKYSVNYVSINTIRVSKYRYHIKLISKDGDVMVIEIFCTHRYKTVDSTISNFHFQCVRGCYNFYSKKIYGTQSFFDYLRTGICTIDKKSFISHNTTPMKLICKYIDRGIKFIIGESDKKLLEHRKDYIIAKYC